MLFTHGHHLHAHNETCTTTSDEAMRVSTTAAPCDAHTRPAQTKGISHIDYFVARLDSGTLAVVVDECKDTSLVVPIDD